AAAQAGEAPRRHESVLPLSAAIPERGLDRAELDRLVDTRERDLDPAPPTRLTALEDYAEGSSAALVLLAMEALGMREPAAREVARSVGIGYGLAGLLRAIPFHARAGRNYIPAEIAARAGLDPADYAALRSTPELGA